ncbi:hypothetical protein LCGC14_2439030 [marine sediment metagenome]|uniref:Uncharacterized protein n=1 Tax=marine sediment metagenome TaxID=412755 RepID=A0A0F9BJR8_9ZZZZ
MPTTTTFTPAEWTAFAADGKTGQKLALVHGYTNPEVQHRNVGKGTPDEEFALTINEADSKSTITTNLTVASLPTALTVVTASQTVTADGVDTKTYDLDGQANKAVTLRWQGAEEINKRSLTLDGTGDGDFIVGV